MTKKKKVINKSPLYLFTTNRNWTKALIINIRATCNRDSTGVFSEKESSIIKRIDALAKQLIDNWDNNTKDVIEEFKTKNQNE